MDSLYEGRPYADCLTTQVEDTVGGRFEVSRFPSDNLTVSPYLLDYEKYRDMLGRIKISLVRQVPITLSLTSFPPEWDNIVTSYGGVSATINEPLLINENDLFYHCEGTYLSPLGLMAVLLRKSYGNEKFKQYVNTHLLREDYYKVSAKNSPTFYFHKKTPLDMDFVKKIGELFPSDRWKLVKDFFIQSPYVFSWRD